MKGIVLFALAVLIPNCLGSLIVGGKESTPHSRPYQVAIMGQDKYQFCGGTLVHRNWVVTAAHCYSGFDTTVYVGLGYHKINKHKGTNQQFIKGTWIVHNKFGQSGQSLDHDIALIRLKTPASMNSDVAAINIASSEPQKGLKMLVSGWGNLDPSSWDVPIELHQVVVYADSQTKCKNAYKGAITDNMFCASVQGGGKDACQGDSGGPIVSNFASNYHQSGVLLRGIVSWGYGCAEAEHPGVYTQISNYCSWISKKTGDAVQCV